jgi:hypothetical protein
MKNSVDDGLRGKLWFSLLPVRVKVFVVFVLG